MNSSHSIDPHRETDGPASQRRCTRLSPAWLALRRRCVPLAETAATLPDFEEDDDA
jgi:hypothetical protein